MFALLLLLTEEASSKLHICFTAPLLRGSGLQGVLLGKTPGEGQEQGLLGSALPCLYGPDWFPSYFSMCHRAELERQLSSLPPAVWFVWLWCPIGIYKVTPEGTRLAQFHCLFSFSKWELTGLSLFPNRAATQLGFSVGWPCSCCGVCWSCIFQLTFYGPARGGDKLMWTKCVVSTVVPAAPLRESR